MKTTFAVLSSLALLCGLIPFSYALGDRPSGSSAQEKILVLGASGRTGRYILKYLEDDGREFVAVTSNRERAAANVGSQYNWVEADVKDPKTLVPIMEGVTKIISSLGANKFEGPNSPEFIDYGGVKNVVDVAVAAGTVDQIVLVSSAGVTQEDHPLNELGNVMTWKLKGEDYLRASPISHTIIRAGGLIEAKDTEADIVGLRLVQGDKVTYNNGSQTNRGTLAAVCIEALSNPDARNKTLEAFNDESLTPGAWRSEFAALAADEK